MTLEKAKSLLTADQIRNARMAGEAWGSLEAEVWRDQHQPEIDLNDDGEGEEGPLPSHPEWTMGTWCGDLPFDRDNDDEVELAEAYEKVLDCAARDAWDSWVEEEKKEIANA